MVLDGKSDAAVQSNQFNQLLTQKTTAIFVGLNDPGALPTLAHDANDNGVLFQAAWNSPAWYTPWHSDADGDKYNTFLMPDEYDAVGKAVDVLAKQIGEEGTIVRVGGYYPSIDGCEVQRRLAVHHTLKKYPKITFAGELHAKYDADLSQRAASSLLARYPDTVGIVAVNDDAATGVIAGHRGGGQGARQGRLRRRGQRLDRGHRAGAGRQAAGDHRQRARLPVVRDAGAVPRPPARLEARTRRTVLRLARRDHHPRQRRGLQGALRRPADRRSRSTCKLLSRTEHPDDFDLQFDGYPVENLDLIWPDVPKPKGFQYPEAYLKAQRNGDFDRIRALYKEHYRTPVLGPSPYGKV